MKELCVYYCPQCGHYGYYQLVRNTICPVCDVKMSLLDLTYSEFTRLTPRERDLLLTRRITEQSTSVVERIRKAEKPHSCYKLVAELVTEIDALTKENQELENTIKWMHQTIWDLLARNRDLQHQLDEGGEVDIGRDE